VAEETLNYTVSPVSLIANSSQYKHELAKVINLSGTEYYYALDVQNGYIDCYNLDKKTFDHQIVLNKTGPDAINISGGLAFDVINQDSIILLSPYKILYIVNREGEKLLEKHLNSLFAQSEYPTQHLVLAAMGVKNMVALPIQYNTSAKSVYVTCWWSRNFMETKYLWEEYGYPVIAKISLTEDKVEFLGRFPFDVTNSHLPRSLLNHFTFDNNGCLLIRFEAADMVYNNCDDSFYCLPSRNSRQNFTSYTKGYQISDEEELEKFNTDGIYSSIHYNPYTNLVYSLYLPPQDKQDSKGLLTQRINSRFSVIISTPTGEIKGEADFPPNTYDFFNINVVKDGLLISRENPYNEHNKEDLYEFDLIKFKL